MTEKAALSSAAGDGDSPHFIDAVCISRGTIDATRQPVRVGGERLVSFVGYQGHSVGCKGLIAPLEA